MKYLLELMLQEFTNPTLKLGPYDGLCTVAFEMKKASLIAGHQRTMLLRLIQETLQNKIITYMPTHTLGSTMCLTTTGVFLYRPYAVKPRVRWLKKMIKKYDSMPPYIAGRYF